MLNWHGALWLLIANAMLLLMKRWKQPPEN